MFSVNNAAVPCPPSSSYSPRAACALAFGSFIWISPAVFSAEMEKDPTGRVCSDQTILSSGHSASVRRTSAMRVEESSVSFGKITKRNRSRPYCATASGFARGNTETISFPKSPRGDISQPDSCLLGPNHNTRLTRSRSQLEIRRRSQVLDWKHRRQKGLMFLPPSQLPRTLHLDCVMGYRVQMVSTDHLY